jgi:hypothetical protein
MNASNAAALCKLAQMFNTTPARSHWHPTEFTGCFSAMEGRLSVDVRSDFVYVSECSDNGHGYMLARRSAAVPKGLSFAQIVEWIRAWIDNKPALPDGNYRVNEDDKIYTGPELTDEQTAYLLSFARSALSAYPLGGSLHVRNGEIVECWGNI